MGRIVNVFLLSTIILGCVSTSTEIGRMPNYGDKVIMAGYTTEEQVIEILGPPTIKQINQDGLNTYIYKDIGSEPSKNKQSEEMIISFDKGGVVISIRWKKLPEIKGE